MTKQTEQTELPFDPSAVFPALGFPLVNVRGQHTGRSFKTFGRNGREILDSLPAGWHIPGLHEALDTGMDAAALDAATQLVAHWGAATRTANGANPSPMVTGIARQFSVGKALCELPTVTFEGIKAANSYYYTASKHRDWSTETVIQSWADRAGLAILKPAAVSEQLTLSNAENKAVADAKALLAVGFTPQEVVDILKNYKR